MSSRTVLQAPVHVPPCFRGALRNCDELEKCFETLQQGLEAYGRLPGERGLSAAEVHVGGGPNPPTAGDVLEAGAGPLQPFDVKCGIGIEATPRT